VLSEWSDFFVTAAGASAALAGLIIVAMSVSIDQLITIPGMTSRGATAIAMLMLVTVTSLAGLIPGQQPLAFGIEVIALATGGLILGLRSLRILLKATSGTRGVLAALTKGVVGLLPFVVFVVGGVLVISPVPGGLVLMAFGALIAFFISVIDAWVMLVEIRR
jgi:modulator of FtsH protease